MEAMDEVSDESMTVVPRSYQLEMFEASLEKNIIVAVKGAFIWEGRTRNKTDNIDI